MEKELQSQSTEGDVKKNGKEPSKKSVGFVKYLLSRCTSDPGYAADMRFAERGTAASLERLSQLDIDLNNEWELMPHAAVAASICRAKPKEDGTLSFGDALRLGLASEKKSGAKSDEPLSPTAKMQLGGLIQCGSPREMCYHVGYLLRMLESASVQNKNIAINYALLLDDLCTFWNTDRRKIVCRRWIMEAYHPLHKEKD